MPFTEPGAWALIAELADGNTSMPEVILQKPAGDIAYSLQVRLAPTEPQLYIKVQIKRGTVWGRSFHYDYLVK